MLYGVLKRILKEGIARPAKFGMRSAAKQAEIAAISAIAAIALSTSNCLG